MFYIYERSCISPQATFADVDLNVLREPQDNKLLAIEPSYAGIPPGALRRMGKAVRMGVGSAISILQDQPKPDGIIIGSANGGKEDSVKFLNQIIEYNEGMLTPMNFVQSTPNAIAGQISLATGNHGYNITHIHLGLAFEFAAIDADMLLAENPGNNYLLGGIDDISVYYYYSESKAGWYKQESISNKYLYDSETGGSIAGEGAALFLVNNRRDGAIACVAGVDTLHHTSINLMQEKLERFINNCLPAGESIDLLLSGENGDRRLLPYYAACEAMFADTDVARFKHMSGEYTSASAMAAWLCCEIFETQTMPAHIHKRQVPGKKYKNILIYNNYKGIQHGFMLLTAV